MTTLLCTMKEYREARQEKTIKMKYIIRIASFEWPTISRGDTRRPQAADVFVRTRDIVHKLHKFWNLFLKTWRFFYVIFDFEWRIFAFECCVFLSLSLVFCSDIAQWCCASASIVDLQTVNEMLNLATPLNAINDEQIKSNCNRMQKRSQTGWWHHSITIVSCAERPDAQLELTDWPADWRGCCNFKIKWTNTNRSQRDRLAQNDGHLCRLSVERSLHVRKQKFHPNRTEFQSLLTGIIDFVVTVNCIFINRSKNVVQMSRNLLFAVEHATDQSQQLHTRK